MTALGWVLAAFGALSMWAAVRDEAIMCILGNAVTGGAADCSR